MRGGCIQRLVHFARADRYNDGVVAHNGDDDGDGVMMTKYDKHDDGDDPNSIQALQQQ